MRIGIDFDNTIVCYDDVFYQAALRKNLIPRELARQKHSVRDYLRREGEEEAWIELQGYVYGACMQEAPPFPGVLDFLVRCKENDIGVFIISHKTRGPFRGPDYDFHQAAHVWLESYGFYDPSRIGMTSEQVYFELTKERKLERISEIRCTHFIDDLPEFLLEPNFPAGVSRILFDPNGNHPWNRTLQLVTSWREIEQQLIKTKSRSPR